MFALYLFCSREETRNKQLLLPVMIIVQTINGWPFQETPLSYPFLLPSIVPGKVIPILPKPILLLSKPSHHIHAPVKHQYANHRRPPAPSQRERVVLLPRVVPVHRVPVRVSRHSMEAVVAAEGFADLGDEIVGEGVTSDPVVVVVVVVASVGFGIVVRRNSMLVVESSETRLHHIPTGLEQSFHFLLVAGGRGSGRRAAVVVVEGIAILPLGHGHDFRCCHCRISVQGAVSHFSEHLGHLRLRHFRRGLLFLLENVLLFGGHILFRFVGIAGGAVNVELMHQRVNGRGEEGISGRGGGVFPPRERSGSVVGG
mmetsp:Transcript_7662/g.13528  ORF Transcript_7662/g.13528 Transcript_7662/m.13528 type:complete len:313 (+) Transcript_7662:57-995(+)